MFERGTRVEATCLRCGGDFVYRVGNQAKVVLLHLQPGCGDRGRNPLTTSGRGTRQGSPRWLGEEGERESRRSDPLSEPAHSPRLTGETRVRCTSQECRWGRSRRTRSLAALDVAPPQAYGGGRSNGRRVHGKRGLAAKWTNSQPTRAHYGTAQAEATAQAGKLRTAARLRSERRLAAPARNRPEPPG